MARERRRWTAEEDGLLRSAVQRAVAEGKPLLWCELARNVPGRSNKDCRRRWCNALNTSISKGPWSEAEDERLWHAVQEHGMRWSKVADAVGSRSSDQCSSHWSLTLNPNINYSQWTQEEDQALLEEVYQHGTNWTAIAAKHQPDRTTLALKNRYAALRAKSTSSRSRSKDSGMRTPPKTADIQCAPPPWGTSGPGSRLPGCGDDHESDGSEIIGNTEGRMHRYSDASLAWPRRMTTSSHGGDGTAFDDADSMQSLMDSIDTTAAMSDLFPRMITPEKSQSPHQLLTHGGGPKTDFKPNYANRPADLIDDPLNCQLDDEMMSDASGGDLCKNTWNDALQAPSYNFDVPPPTSHVDTSSLLMSTPTAAPHKLRRESGVTPHRASLAGPGVHDSISGDDYPTAVDASLQRMSLDVLCSSDQMAPIMNSVVSRAASMTVKVYAREE